MNLNESMLKIDGLDSLSLIKSGVYKDTYGCVYKGKNAILGHYRIQENHFNLNPQREANILIKINDIQLAPETLFFDKNASIIITSMQARTCSASASAHNTTAASQAD